MPFPQRLGRRIVDRSRKLAKTAPFQWAASNHTQQDTTPSKARGRGDDSVFKEARHATSYESDQASAEAAFFWVTAASLQAQVGTAGGESAPFDHLVEQSGGWGLGHGQQLAGGGAAGTER